MRMLRWGGKSMLKTISVILITFLLSQTTLASYTIGVYLDKFSNPGQKLFNGEACDYPTRNDQCEHQFHICLDYSNGDQYNYVQCRVKGPFTLDLGNWAVSRVEQPWQGDIFMKVYVSDRDHDTLQLVDTLSYIIKLDAHRSIAEAQNHHEIFTMNGSHTNLTLGLVVYCNHNWIGPHCDCDKKDPRYQCDNDGKKICNEHWFGPDCECSPAAGIHDDCTLTDTKRCNNDYYGEDCDIYCKSTDGSTGHYICDQNGNKICNKNWCSANCDVICGELQTVTVETDSGNSSRSVEGPIHRTNDGTNAESAEDGTESKTNAGKLTLILIIGGVAGAMAFFIIGLTAFFCKRKKRLQSVPIDTLPLQKRSSPLGHDNNIRMNEGFDRSSTPAGPAYKDCFPNLSENRQACAAASTSNDVYAVPDKKTNKQNSSELVDASDDMLIVENELYGAASDSQTQSHTAGAAAYMSDDMLIVDNEVYGSS